MIHVLQQIFERALARLTDNVLAYLPPLIVAALLLGSGLLLATLLRWLILRAVRARALDRFLLDSGFGPFIDRSGRLRAVVLIAGVAHWSVLGIALLLSIDVFDTTLTSRMVQATVFAVPKLITAAAILFAGYWLAQHLGRSALIWAVNEEGRMARRLALGVRAAVMFFAIVVAADTLGFAARVFFSTFLIVAGGAALAASIAAGLALRSGFERWLQRREQPPQPDERSLWSHL